MKTLELNQMTEVEGGTCAAGIGVAMASGALGYAALFGPFAFFGGAMIACVAGAMVSNM